VRAENRSKDRALVECANPLAGALEWDGSGGRQLTLTWAHRLLGLGASKLWAWIIDRRAHEQRLRNLETPSHWDGHWAVGSRQ
jgi:hypothetical protein